MQKSIIVAVLLSVPSFVLASEVTIALYFGKVFSVPGDIRITRNNGSQAVFQDVSWKDRSFELPFYYSLRIQYWSDKDSQHGITLDFTHAKLYSNLRETVEVSRLSSEGSQDSRELVGDSFTRLAFSHGYNMLSMNALYRSPVSDHDSYHETSAYVGGGIGIAIPHVEIQFEGNDINNYRPVGWIWQGMTGAVFGSHANPPFGVEYKFSYGDAGIELPDHTTVELSALLHHFSAGPVFR